MKRLFKFNNLEQVKKLVDVVNAQHYNIIIDKENNLLLVDEDVDNFNLTLMYLMQVIKNNEHIQNYFSAWFDGLDRIHEMPIFLNEKPCLASWSIDGKTTEEGIIIDYTIQEIKMNQESLKTKGNPNNLGIENINSFYIETNELQEAEYEYRKITKFLEKYKKQYANITNQNIEDIKIKFINYGKTELVFVLTDKLNKQYTLLVKQPNVTFGDVKKEAEYLIELNALHNNIVAPIDYFSLYDQELYVAPYIFKQGVLQAIRNGESIFQNHFIDLKIFLKNKKVLLTHV